MTLRLYSYWRSSSAWRVRIGLALKGLAYEYRAVDLLHGGQFQDAYQALNPMVQVPVLEIEEAGRTVRLAQSMAILEWLDERHPQPPLLPADLLGRARVQRALDEKLPVYGREWAKLWIERGLDALEREVRGGAGRFCHGDTPSLADCYLVPQLYASRRFGVDVAPWPTLHRIEEACAALPAFQAAAPDHQPDAPPSDRRTP